MGSPGYSSNRLVFCCCGDVCYCMNAEDESLSFYQRLFFISCRRIFFFIFIFFRRISSLIVFIFIYIFSQIAQNIVFIEYVFLSKSFVIEWINDIAGGLSLSEYFFFYLLFILFYAHYSLYVFIYMSLYYFIKAILL